MPTIKRTKTGQYTTLVTIGTDVDGKRAVKRITAETPTAVKIKIDREKQLFREEQAAIREERAAAASGKPDPKKTTVRQAVTSYIERCETKPDFSPSTIRSYYSYAKNMFPVLMPMLIADLTEELVQTAINEEQKKLSPKSVVNRWNLLRPAVRAVDRDFAPDAELPALHRKRLKMPDVERLRMLFELVDGKPMDIPVALAATCGLRRGEVSAIDLHKDVDYLKHTLHIDKVYVENKEYRWELKPYPKTDAGIRTVIVPGWVLEKLSAARDDPNFVMLKPFAITNRYKTLKKKTGISCSFHGLRHYFASVMSSLHVPDEYQMERMGHSTRYMLDRYREYLKETEVQIDEDLQGYMNALDPRAKKPE